jgi:hypothetical protein
MGHKFAKLPDHPVRNGMARCPICMDEGLDAARVKSILFPENEKTWTDMRPTPLTAAVLRQKDENILQCKWHSEMDNILIEYQRDLVDRLHKFLDEVEQRQSSVEVKKEVTPEHKQDKSCGQRGLEPD